MRLIIGLLFFAAAYFMVEFSEYTNTAISSIAIILIALPSYYYFTKKDKKKTLLTILAISLFAITIETIGILTGFPYSQFYYNQLGYKIFGVTPWTVFFAFTPLVLGAIYYAKTLTKKTQLIFLFSIIILVATDLILDPVAVKLGFWTWLNPGAYYDIPIQNYLGWIFSSLIAVAIYYYFNKTKTYKGQELSLYYSTWLWLGASYFMKLWIPFFIGIILIVIYHETYKINKKKYK